MSILKKLSLALATLCTIMVLTVQSAYAGKVTINLGHGGGEKSAYGPLAEKFAELAGKYSNGSIEVKVRCCAQLIKEDEAFKAMQLGTVDMSIITGNNLSPHFALTDAFFALYI
jgi:TRAP-type C4-dicarboxylate transport system substrate-binding protein